MSTDLPAGLTGKAAQFWRDVAGTYALRADQLVLLEAACRAMRVCERLEVELEDAAATDPLQQELSEYRLHVAEMLAALDLENAPTRGLRLVVDNTATPDTKDTDA